MSTHTFESAALQLHAQGYEPIPVIAGKCPVQGWEIGNITPEQISEWGMAYPKAGVAIRTNGLAAFEIDVPHLKWRQAIERELGKQVPQWGPSYVRRQDGLSLLFSTSALENGFRTCPFQLPTGEVIQVRVASEGKFAVVSIEGDSPLLNTPRKDLPGVEMNQLRRLTGKLTESLVAERPPGQLPTAKALSSPAIVVDNQPPTFASAGPALLEAGFKPIPVDGKRPVVKRWDEAPMHPDQVAIWARDHGELNIGLRSEDMCAVDIDIYDQEAADTIEKAFVERFGQGLKRLGQAPKRLLLYGAKAPGYKITSPSYEGIGEKAHRVEVLGIGQQFVAYGIHPDTRRPYEWVGDGPLDVERWQLNVIDREEVAAWVRNDLDAILTARGLTPKVGGSGNAINPTGSPLDPDDPFDAIKQRHDDVTLTDLAWMLEHLDPGYCDDRDNWRNAIFAVHHQFHGTGQEEEAFNLVDAWSAKSAKYTADCVRPIWDGAAEQRLGLVTIGTLKAWLGDSWKGYKRTEKGRQHAADVLEQLRRMSNDDVSNRWCGLSADLSPVDLDNVLQEVSRLTGAKIQPLKATLATYKRERARTQRAAAVLEKIGRRESMLYDPTRTARQARNVEKRILEWMAVSGTEDQYVRFAGQISALVEDRLPHSHSIDDEDPDSAPLVPTLRALDRTAFRACAEEVVAFTRMNEYGEPVPCEIPPPVLDGLKAGSLEVPTVSGLVPHPIVRLNGEILTATGLHPCGLIVTRGLKGCRAYSRDEACDAIKRITEGFCAGFTFETPLDKAAALAGLFTGVQRRVLDQAPGVLVLASSQGTGKTTLARRLHVILTRCDLPTVTFPVEREEQRKAMLAMLTRAPAMICYDNIPDGLNFRSDVLATVLTTSMWQERILGVSDPVSVPTSTLFVVTGNNLSLGRDELTRLIPVRLKTSGEKLGHRQFEHPDVVGHALRIRDQVLRDVIGIVAGYLASELHKSTRPASRFLHWDRLVRQPLLWAGVTEDVAGVFDNNEAGSEELAATGYVLRVLHEHFGARTFSARDVAVLPSKMPGGWLDEGEEESPAAMFSDALTAIPCKDPSNPQAVGYALKKISGFVATVVGSDGRSLRFKLEKAVDNGNQNRRFGTAYRVVEVC